MKLKFILLLLVLTMMSACSIFSRDKTGYEDSDSVSDLEMPPELNLPKRDTNYDIPEAQAEAPQETSEVAEQVHSAVEAAAEEVEAEVEEAVKEAVDTSE